MRKEIKFGGFGGQGIILAGMIAGRAASLYDGLNAVFTQSYGPEARGGATSSEVVISKEPVDYPYVISADVLVLMSKEAYDKYISMAKDGGLVLIDEDLIELDERTKGKKISKIKATKVAEGLGNRIVANIVMLGFFTATTGIVSKEAMIKSVKDSVPSRFIDLNIRAFEEGYKKGKEAVIDR